MGKKRKTRSGVELLQSRSEREKEMEGKELVRTFSHGIEGRISIESRHILVHTHIYNTGRGSQKERGVFFSDLPLSNTRQGRASEMILTGKRPAKDERREQNSKGGPSLSRFRPTVHTHTYTQVKRPNEMRRKRRVLSVIILILLISRTEGLAPGKRPADMHTHTHTQRDRRKRFSPKILLYFRAQLLMCKGITSITRSID